MTKNISTPLLFMGIVIAGSSIGFNIVHIPDQLMVVVLLAALMFYPVFRYPIAGVYLIFGILPFVAHVRRLYYLAYDRPTADPLIVIGDIIIIFMIVGLVVTLREQMQRGVFNKSVIRIVFLYFMYLVVRTFAFNDLPLSLAAMRFRFYGPAILLFFIGIVYAGNHQHVKRLWLLTIVIGIVAAAYGVKQFLYGYSDAEKIWFSSIDFTSLFIMGIARPFSLFQAPAAFADYMQIACIGIAYFTALKGGLAAKGAWALVPFFFSGLLITSVRSSWIGFAIFVVLWLVILRIKSMRHRVVTMVVLCVLFVSIDVARGVVQSDLNVNSMTLNIGMKTETFQKYDLFVKQRVQGVTNPFEEHSFVSRVGLWGYIISLTRDPYNAVLGRGIGTFNADSLYMTHLAELGYPGLVLIVLIFFLFIKNAFMLMDRSQNPAITALAKVVVAMNLVFAIINSTGSHINAFPGDVYFWFWNGMLTGLSSADGLLKEQVHENTGNA